LFGASVGREGPTVQIAAAIMGYSHRLMRVPLRASVYIAARRAWPRRSTRRWRA
jgi:H+/Cl- antiporter ClcA